MAGNILAVEDGQVILAAMLFSMATAPLVIRYNHQISDFIFARANHKKKKQIKDNMIETSHTLNKHALVCGYGRVGIHTIDLLSSHAVPCMAIDLKPAQVQKGVENSLKVSYGDAGNLEFLNACGLSRASDLIISIIDFNTALKIIIQVRSVNESIPIVVLTRKELHLYQLYQAGATDVVADVFGHDQMITLERMYELGITKHSDHVH
ncbi:MAG: NAD-binding protein [Mariprofundaceae bacterium]|nr:NAD-binding protein [Mariprofundaceae bacterium]